MIATDQPAGAYSWLDAGAVRTASDIALGCILLVAGAVAILNAPAISFSDLDGLNPNFFPTVLGGLLLAVGIVLLARGSIFGGPRPARWSLKGLAIIVAAVVAICAAAWGWDLVFQRFGGPPEHAAAIVLGLAVAIALVRRSRVQAVGMMLLGLLLATVGLDAITGIARLTFGRDQLFYGIESPVIFGFFVVADGLVCLVSPSLWLATYARLVDGWAAPRIPAIAAIGMRGAAALAIAAACYLAFELGASALDIGLLLAFAAFGVAGKLLAWNRLVLLVAFVLSNGLELSVRQSMLVLDSEPDIFLRWPFSGAFLLLAGGVLALAALLSARRILARPTERGFERAS